MSMELPPDSAPENPVPQPPPWLVRPRKRVKGPGVRFRHWVAPAAVLCAGVMLVMNAAVVEMRWMDTQPWSNAIVLEAQEDQDDDTAIPVWALPLPVSEPVRGLFRAASSEGEPEGLEGMAGWLAAIAVEPDDLQPLLEAGRVPNPGTLEIVAGALAPDTQIVVNGAKLTVVGRLSGSVGAFVDSYLLPIGAEPLPVFLDAPEAREGLLLPDGPLEDVGDTARPLMAQPGQTTRSVSFFILVGMALVACGGALLYRLFFAWIRRAMPRWLRPVLVEYIRRRAEWNLVHGLLYGLMFGVMAVFCFYPRIALFASHYVAYTFGQGGLSYVGKAYSSGDILHAAGATFFNNYVIQTLVLTFGPSLLLVPLGALKTAASLGLVGVAMAPVWTFVADVFWYHSITMALEIEAYILAVFVVFRWTGLQLFTLFLRPRALWNVLRCQSGTTPESRHLQRKLCWNFAVLIGGVVWSGIMLAVAALYEAATLIILS